MSHPNPEDAARERLAAHTRAREAGDDAAIRASITEAAKAADADLAGQARTIMSAAYAMLDPDADGAAIIAAEAEAWHTMPRPVRLAALAIPADTGGAARHEALADSLHEPEPEPVVWRADKGDRWPLVSIGEPGILSGPGGTGKSYLALALALAAAKAAPQAAPQWPPLRIEVGGGADEALGLHVRPGPVLLVAYEDSRARLAGRVKRIADRDIPENLYILRDPGPLFRGGGDRRPGDIDPTPEWASLWASAAELKPSLIVLDPAAELLADVPASDTGPVRAFMRELARRSAEHGCGVLIVAHDTKANRSAVRKGEGPDAGAVAGSAAWADRARGVAYMAPDPNDDARLVEAVKVNHGRDRWGMRLIARPDKTFAGWELKEVLEPGGVQWERNKTTTPQGKAGARRSQEDEGEYAPGVA